MDALEYIEDRLRRLDVGTRMPIAEALIVDVFGSLDGVDAWIAANGCKPIPGGIKNGLITVEKVAESPNRPRGRPPAPPSVPISIRVTVEQNEAYKSAGGAKWLKSLLDKHIKKQK